MTRNSRNGLRKVLGLLVAILAWTAMAQAYSEGIHTFPRTSDELLWTLAFWIALATGFTAALYVRGLQNGRVLTYRAYSLLRLANRDRMRSDDAFVLSRPTLLRSPERFFSELVYYAIGLVAFLTIVMWSFGHAMDRVLFGNVMAAMVTPVSVIFLIYNYRTRHPLFRGILTAAVFLIALPAAGILVAQFRGQWEFISLMLLIFPLVIIFGFSIAEWIPAAGRRLANALRRKAFGTQGNADRQSLAFFRLSASIARRLYSSDVLRTWQLIIAVGVWGISWGVPLLSATSSGDTARELKDDLDSLATPEVIAMLWGLIGLMPIARLLGSTLLRTIAGRRSPSPDSVFSATASLGVFLVLAPIMFLPLQIILAVSEAIFGPEGIALVVEFYVFPVMFPWIYSVLAAGLLLVVADMTWLSDRALGSDSTSRA